MGCGKTFPTQEGGIKPQPALSDGPATTAVSCDPADSCDAGGQVIPRAWGRERCAANHSNYATNITHILFCDNGHIHASAHIMSVSTTKRATCDITCDAYLNPFQDTNPQHHPTRLPRRLLRHRPQRVGQGWFPPHVRAVLHHGKRCWLVQRW